MNNSSPQLKEFTPPPWWRTSSFWGNGWEAGKDPASQGWRIRRLRPNSDEIVLVGISNKKGCFSARIMGGGRLDVALYGELTPQEVLKGLSTDVVYMTVDHYPGWALAVRDELLALEEGTKSGAKGPQKEVLDEPALNPRTDTTLRDHLKNTGNAGVNGGLVKWELVLVFSDGREVPHWSSYTRERSREALRSLKSQNGGKLPLGSRAIIRRISI